ncbi:hypothetical protein [Sphingobacterium corticibacter]|uniref:EamA family transporter n=1 Tax=Sphingobacterium corticibacter TaxID=2171749 RepID=A0A2T8HMN7_9SPHI|nr:hypothetical protein [Sphingobacterium corticibacter]PVH26718.1 hypothetical protein DC487_03670 [Sphingobacterium corticibacter]
MNALYFIAFWACQLISSVLFKYGGIYPKYHWHAFIAGNAILLTASWFLIQLFRYFPQPIVIALCSGGTFVTVQFGMALYFKQSLSWVQIVGLFFIVTGIVITAYGTTGSLSLSKD